MVSDPTVPQAPAEGSYNVLFPKRDDSNMSDRIKSPLDLALFINGSNTELGTGAGVAGTYPRVEISINLGRHTTIFQVETIAIELVVRELNK
ncbi:unnamed protein product [Callosobruchus maculatus]|uniref:Uncharacterized protein n=1 Tax=Callosobruchus maculatus TaxID=64391 RepID=A0A653C3K0_CALMS|nr:unnamed protein product [Callosobruchus maculatus]